VQHFDAAVACMSPHAGLVETTMLSFGIMKPTRRRNPSKKSELPETVDDDYSTSNIRNFTSSKLFKACLILVMFGIPLYIIYVKHELPSMPCPEEAKPRTVADELPRYHGPAGLGGALPLAVDTLLIPPAAVEFPTRYTLVLNSYKRHKLLQRSIAHYSSCTGIDAIRVVSRPPPRKHAHVQDTATWRCPLQVWCEDGLPPTRASNKAFYSEHKEVRYDVMPNSSLNNRFTPLEGQPTTQPLALITVTPRCHT
jgi:hypothetical protein